MKKLIAILLCLLTVFALFSCDFNEDVASDETPTESKQNSKSQSSGGGGGGATVDPKPTEAEIAMEMYEAAVNDEINVVTEDLGEMNFSACRFPTNDLRVDESIIYGNFILDMDQDGINEYIITSYAHDSILLHYYDGKVYSFAFKFEEFNNLTQDGSFSWNGPMIGDSLFGVYDRGVKKLSFDGAAIKYEDIYKTVYDENETASYYIGEEEVTHEEMLEYLSTRSYEFAEVTPFEAPWYHVITEKEAVQIASDYWNIKIGDIDPDTGYRFSILPKYSTSNCYCIALSILVEESHYSTIEMIEINAFTGEVITPNYGEPDGKG